MSDADLREGGRVRCANPTCRTAWVVDPAVKRQIEGGRVETIDRFCLVTGAKLIVDGGEPRLFCERCAF